MIKKDMEYLELTSILYRIEHNHIIGLIVDPLSENTLTLEIMILFVFSTKKKS